MILNPDVRLFTLARTGRLPSPLVAAAVVFAILVLMVIELDTSESRVQG